MNKNFNSSSSNVSCSSNSTQLSSDEDEETSSDNDTDIDLDCGIVLNYVKTLSDEDDQTEKLLPENTENVEKESVTTNNIEADSLMVIEDLISESQVNIWSYSGGYWTLLLYFRKQVRCIYIRRKTLREI